MSTAEGPAGIVARARSAREITEPGEIRAMFRRRDAEELGVTENDVPDRVTEAGLPIRRHEVGLVVSKRAKLSEGKLRSILELREIPWRDEYVGRDVPYWLSDERVDGHGDLVLQEWDFSTYERNPVLAFSHDWNGLSLGAGIDWQVVNRVEDDYSGRALFFRALFAPESIQPAADGVFRMVDAGLFRGISAGFVPHKVIAIEDDDERAELGLGRWGMVLAQNELLEGSPTLLPANVGAHVIESALARAKQRRLLRPGDIAVLRESERLRIAGGARSGEEWAERDGLYLRVARLLFPREVFVEHKELDAPIDVGAPAGGDGLVAPAPAEPTAEQRMAALPDAVESLSALLSEGLQSVLAGIDDVRDGLEGLRAELAAEIAAVRGVDDEAKQNAPGPEGSAENRLEAVLAKVEEFRRANQPARPC